MTARHLRMEDPSMDQPRRSRLRFGMPQLPVLVTGCGSQEGRWRGSRLTGSHAGRGLASDHGSGGAAGARAQSCAATCQPKGHRMNRARTTGLAGALIVLSSVLSPALAYAASDQAAGPMVASVHSQEASPACTETIRAVGNGVRVRTAPNLSATVVGETYRGQTFTAGCYTVQGAKYTACGFTEVWWVYMKFAGAWRYSPAACYTP